MKNYYLVMALLFSFFESHAGDCILAASGLPMPGYLEHVNQSMLEETRFAEKCLEAEESSKNVLEKAACLFVTLDQELAQEKERKKQRSLDKQSEQSLSPRELLLATVSTEMNKQAKDIEAKRKPQQAEHKNKPSKSQYRVRRPMEKSRSLNASTETNEFQWPSVSERQMKFARALIGSRNRPGK